MRLYKNIAALTLAGAMMLGVASCGSSAGTSTPAASSKGSASSAAASSADDADAKVIKIGISTDSMPNCYLDENGELAGENYEVMCLVDEMLPQYKFEYEPLTQDVILTGMDTTTISNMGVGLNQVCLIMEVIACWRLPKLMPEAYENATMKMKLPVLRVLLVLSIVLNVATFYVSLSDMTLVVWISIIVFVVLLAIYTSIRGKQLEAKKVI